MSSRSNLIPMSVWIVQAARVLNGVCAIGFALALIASFPAAAAISAQLVAKYGAGVDAPRVLNFLRGMLLFGLPMAYVVEHLLRALRGVLGAVAADDPFDSANARRLRTIGWTLLAVQAIDLSFGLTVWLTRPPLIELASWQPSPTGWLATLVAFVLVRVFAAGAALRDDLAGTV